MKLKEKHYLRAKKCNTLCVCACVFWCFKSFSFYLVCLFSTERVNQLCTHHTRTECVHAHMCIYAQYKHFSLSPFLTHIPPHKGRKELGLSNTFLAFIYAASALVFPFRQYLCSVASRSGWWRWCAVTLMCVCVCVCLLMAMTMETVRVREAHLMVNFTLPFLCTHYLTSSNLSFLSLFLSLPFSLSFSHSN